LFQPLKIWWTFDVHSTLEKVGNNSYINIVGD
jgi:hypothetical protein